MFYTIMALATAGFFLTIGDFRWRRKAESIQDPKKRAAFALPLVQQVFQRILRRCRVTVEVEGMENLQRIPKEEGVLFVGNHRSYFDVIIAYTLVDRPTGFVAKIEMEKLKPLKRWMEYLGCLFMDRSNLKQSLKVILAAIRQIREGSSIWIYPEGTRADGATELEMEPFKEGSFKIAEKTGCKIVPVSMVHTRSILEQQFPRICPQKVKVRIGAPIELKTLDEENRKHIGAYVEGKIRDDLQSMLSGDTED